VALLEFVTADGDVEQKSAEIVGESVPAARNATDEMDSMAAKDGMPAKRVTAAMFP
jgi:hypothetical protein